MASLLDWLNPQQQQQPQFDKFGVQLPGAPQQQTDMGKHYKDVLGGQQQLTPDQMQIILQMLGAGNK